MRSRADWLVPVLWQASRGTHRPDIGVEVAGRRVAIEVELCVKAPRRLRAILAGYEALIAAGSLSGGVVYVSDRDDVLAAVTRAAAAVGVPEGRLRTRSLVRCAARAAQIGLSAPASHRRCETVDGSWHRANRLVSRGVMR